MSPIACVPSTVRTRYSQVHASWATDQAKVASWAIQICQAAPFATAFEDVVAPRSVGILIPLKRLGRPDPDSTSRADICSGEEIWEERGSFCSSGRHGTQIRQDQRKRFSVHPDCLADLQRHRTQPELVAGRVRESEKCWLSRRRDQTQVPKVGIITTIASETVTVG